ncbi:MAG TPA: hypothetical protein EYN70_09595 [Planctomycetaceae bacterium]|nr:hypothetical protein [Planctomycetaceae bacterium]
MKHENKTLDQFAADLGKTAFAASLSGNVVATRRFDVRRTLHDHLEALKREKDELGRTDASKLTEKVKLKARQLKLAAEVKIGQLKIGSLDRTLGEALLKENEESSVDSFQTREVLDAITRQRATIAATTKKQDHAQSQLAATLADVARTLDRKSVESGAVLQAELKQVRREARRIEKSIAKAREAIVNKALEDKILRDSTQLGPKLEQLWSTQFDLKASKSQAANKVARRLSTLSQPVKYIIYGAVVCLLLIIAGIWFGRGDEGSQSLSEKDKKPESTGSTERAPDAATVKKQGTPPPSPKANRQTTEATTVSKPSESRRQIDAIVSFLENLEHRNEYLHAVFADSIKSAYAIRVEDDEIKYDVFKSHEELQPNLWERGTLSVKLKDVEVDPSTKKAVLAIIDSNSRGDRSFTSKLTLHFTGNAWRISKLVGDDSLLKETSPRYQFWNEILSRVATGNRTTLPQIEIHPEIATLVKLNVFMRTEKGEITNVYTNPRTKLNQAMPLVRKLKHMRSFSSSEITDVQMSHLRDLPQLTSIHLLDNPNISDVGLQHLRGLKNLASLRISNDNGTSKVSGSGLQHLTGLKQLEDLSLLGNPVSDGAIQYLRGMKTIKNLNLTSTNITDAGLLHLKNMVSLQSLSLDVTAVTDRGLAHLSSIKTLSYLSLNATNVTGPGLAHLAELPNLVNLSLRESRITDAGLVHLKDLTKLQDLNLYNTKISDAGLVHLRGLRLRQMTTDEILNLQPKRWSYLRIGGTKISAAGKEMLKKQLGSSIKIIE